jgi:hypothetical protein
MEEKKNALKFRETEWKKPHWKRRNMRLWTRFIRLAVGTNAAMLL